MNWPCLALATAWLLCLLRPCWCQTALLWNPPSGVQSDTVTLLAGSPMPPWPLLTNITFNASFASVPEVLLSLGSLGAVTRPVAISQNASTITVGYFEHELQVANSSGMARLLRVCYTAVDLSRFIYFYPHTVQVQMAHLNQSNTPDSELIRISYATPLQAGHQYQLGAVLSGFNCISTGAINIAIHAQLDTPDNCLLSVTSPTSSITHVQVTWYLVDQTEEAALPTGLNQLLIRIGYVEHYRLLEHSHYYPERIDFHSEAVFYGIMGYRLSFESVVEGSINNRPNPPANLKIGYAVFLEKLCPSDYPHYEPVTQSCFSECRVRLYQSATLRCGLCYHSCYTCSGPTLTQCQLHLQMQSTLVPATSLSCNPGYVAIPLTGHCRLCAALVSGCWQCTPDGTCLVCQSGCALVNGSYCDCSLFCNSSARQYYYSHTRTCECEFQHYLDYNGRCTRCDAGCYICWGVSSNCSVCIEGYELIMNYCLFFQKTKYVMDLSFTLVGGSTRCIQQITQSCLNYCMEQQYYYRGLCWVEECPFATFPIADIDGNRMCQPCTPPCIDCDTAYLCKKCQPGGYFPHSGMCLSCMQGCQSCDDALTCSQCSPDYSLTNNTCVQILPQYSFACMVGCEKCLIYEYCEICKQGYYRQGQQCIQCRGEGLYLQSQLVGDSVVLQCKDECGDGLVHVDSCDDGNTVDGDGCSSECRVEQGYQCWEVAGSGSICYRDDYSPSCQVSVNQTANQLNISVMGYPSPLSIIPVISCPPHLRLLSYTTSPTPTFTLAYSSSPLYSTCTLALPPTPLPPLPCNISALPPPLPYNHQHSLLLAAQSALGSLHKPMAVVAWGMLVAGVEGPGVMVAVQGVYWCVGMGWPPGHQGQLRYWALDYEDGDALQPAYKQLLLILGAVVLREVVPRVLTRLQCCSPLGPLLQHLFHHRAHFYIYICSTLQPSALSYINRLLQDINEDNRTVYLVVVVLHVLCMLGSAVAAAWVLQGERGLGCWVLVGKGLAVVSGVLEGGWGSAREFVLAGSVALCLFLVLLQLPNQEHDLPPALRLKSLLLTLNTLLTMSCLLGVSLLAILHPYFIQAQPTYQTLVIAMHMLIVYGLVVGAMGLGLLTQIVAVYACYRGRVDRAKVEDSEGEGSRRRLDDSEQHSQSKISFE